MNYFCAGKTANRSYCKNLVRDEGDYCVYHNEQRNSRINCKCTLDNGLNCSYPPENDGFCKYHDINAPCKGQTIATLNCTRFVSESDYCCFCIKKLPKKDTSMEDIERLADSMRSKLKEPLGLGPLNPARPIKVATSSSLNISIEIPKSLQLKSFEGVDDKTCIICIEDMTGKLGVKHRRLACGHCFHLDCISGIIKLECPACRGVIKEGSGHLPKWVIEKIKDNIEHEAERREEENLARAIEIAARQVVERRSQAEIDFVVMREAENTPRINYWFSVRN